MKLKKQTTMWCIVSDKGKLDENSLYKKLGWAKNHFPEYLKAQGYSIRKVKVTIEEV